jgi:outer membrane protein OmpA-like peptidoglycan-associated protein
MAEKPSGKDRKEEATKPLKAAPQQAAAPGGSSSSETVSAPEKRPSRPPHVPPPPVRGRPLTVWRVGILIILAAWMFLVGVLVGRGSTLREQTELKLAAARQKHRTVPPPSSNEPGSEPTLLAEMNGRKSLIVVSTFGSEGLFGDPVAQAAALKEKYGDVGVYAISFAADAAGVQRAKALAETGRCGRYFDGSGLLDHPDRFQGMVREIFLGSLDDQDGDGVCDAADKCPDTRNADRVDEFGCPTAVSITLHIEFPTGGTDIGPQYREQIAQVADRLTKFTDTKATIEGYTDDQGADENNRRLSQKRAESVRDYLIREFKIPADRLKAVGYGESNPVADNATPEGRQKNRRVEAIIATDFNT